MSDFETPLMRDISKLLTPIMFGIVIAVVLMFSITPLNSMYHSLLWEVEQFDKGFTWEDKRLNGCFENDEGITYFDKYSMKEVTTTLSCSSNSLPWEYLVWGITSILIPIILILEIRLRQHNSVVFSLIDKILELRGKQS